MTHTITPSAYQKRLREGNWRENGTVIARGIVHHNLVRRRIGRSEVQTVVIEGRETGR